MTAIRGYRPSDPERVDLVSRGVPFASLDPGSEGALLVWRQGSAVRWPVAPDVAVPITARAGGADLAARACERLGVRVLLVEDQFLGRQTKNFATTKRLIFTAGVVVGYIMQSCELEDVVQVHPATWLVGLPKHSDGKKRAQLHAGRLLPGWLNTFRGGLRSGCADALGLADWFAR
jgi:hypothetical protein